MFLYVYWSCVAKWMKATQNGSSFKKLPNRKENKIKQRRVRRRLMVIILNLFLLIVSRRVKMYLAIGTAAIGNLRNKLLQHGNMKKDSTPFHITTLNLTKKIHALSVYHIVALSKSLNFLLFLEYSHSRILQYQKK